MVHSRAFVEGGRIFCGHTLRTGITEGEAPPHQALHGAHPAHQNLTDSLTLSLKIRVKICPVGCLTVKVTGPAPVD